MYQDPQSGPALREFQGRSVAQVPKAFEDAFGVSALVNPRASIDIVEPLAFPVGDEIKLDVYYTPANDEESSWQTMCVVKQGASVLCQERSFHISKSPGQEKADCNTGLDMPSTNVTLTVEIWGHPDYFTTTRPY